MVVRVSIAGKYRPMLQRRHMWRRSMPQALQSHANFVRKPYMKTFRSRYLRDVVPPAPSLGFISAIFIAQRRVVRFIDRQVDGQASLFYG